MAELHPLNPAAHRPPPAQYLDDVAPGYAVVVVDGVRIGEVVKPPGRFWRAMYYGADGTVAGWQDTRSAAVRMLVWWYVTGER